MIIQEFGSKLSHLRYAIKKEIRKKRKLTQSKSVCAQELNLLLDFIAYEPNGTVKMIYPNRTSAPTYGDLLVFLMCGRFLRSLGLKLELYLIDTDMRRHDWPDGRKQQEEFIVGQFELCKMVLGNDCKIIHNAKRENEFMQSQESESAFILFRDLLQNCLPVYNHSWTLLDGMFYRFGLPNGFLLGDRIKLETQINEYVVWNTRYSIYDLKRNNQVDNMILDLEIIRYLYPDTPIIWCGNKASRTFAEKAVESTGAYVDFYDKYSFLQAANLVLESKFYFQRLSGGLSNVARFSEIPYLILTWEKMWERNMITYKRGMPWAKNNQVELILKEKASSISLVDLLSRGTLDL